MALEKDQRSLLNPAAFAGFGQQRDYGEATADAIDSEVHRILDQAFDRTVTILTERRELLEKTAAGCSKWKRSTRRR